MPTQNARHTRKHVLLALGFAAVALIAGCGGGGDNDKTVTRSPFAGDYSGTFTTGSGQRGTTILRVGSGGAVSGTVSNTTTNAQGPVSGTIDRSGDAAITFTYTGLGSAQLAGTVRYNTGSTALVGNLTQSQNGTVVDTVSVSLEKIPAADTE